MTTIKWVSENMDPNDPTVRGYWRSSNGRFSISPNFRHTVYPDSYTVRDEVLLKSFDADTVRDCKAWALHKAQQND